LWTLFENLSVLPARPAPVLLVIIKADSNQRQTRIFCRRASNLFLRVANPRPAALSRNFTEELHVETQNGLDIEEAQGTESGHRVQRVRKTYCRRAQDNTRRHSGLATAISGNRIFGLIIAIVFQ
jgi:hypothetical protein